MHQGDVLGDIGRIVVPEGVVVSLVSSQFRMLSRIAPCKHLHQVLDIRADMTYRVR
jgi:hypothetical protein